mmetsp:Transcript_18872/g.54651  ORF Transcript_18872/g.54651 Transcript_18872/m.54651 type:complete len:243 (-) Transcript_18872:2027-2755(-)
MQFHLFALLQGIEEHVGGEGRQLSVDALIFLPIDKDLGIECVRQGVLVGDLLVKVFALKLLPRLVEVVIVELSAGTSLDGIQSSSVEDLGPEGLGETTGGDTNLPPQVLDDRLGKGERIGLFENLPRIEILRYHKLREISHHLGRRSDLGYIPQYMIRLGVFTLDLGPLLRQSQLTGLIEEVGVLSSGNFVAVHVGRTRQLSRFEGSVERTDVLPVRVEFARHLVVDSGVEVGSSDGGGDGP